MSILAMYPIYCFVMWDLPPPIDQWRPYTRFAIGAVVVLMGHSTGELFGRLK